MYQKAYVEFFCAPDKLQQLLEKLDTAPSITYIAVNAQGDVRTNTKENAVNAVTWGVFPGGKKVSGIRFRVSDPRCKCGGPWDAFDVQLALNSGCVVFHEELAVKRSVFVHDVITLDRAVRNHMKGLVPWAKGCSV